MKLDIFRKLQICSVANTSKYHDIESYGTDHWIKGDAVRYSMCKSHNLIIVNDYNIKRYVRVKKIFRYNSYVWWQPKIILKYYIVKWWVTIKMGKQNVLLKYQPVSKLETIICDLTSSFCYNFACHARVRPFRTFLFDPIEIQTPHLIALCLV